MPIVLLSSDIPARAVLFALKSCTLCRCHRSIRFCAAFCTAHPALFAPQPRRFLARELAGSPAFTYPGPLGGLTGISHGGLVLRKASQSRDYRKGNNGNYLFHDQFGLRSAWTEETASGLMRYRIIFCNCAWKSHCKYAAAAQFRIQLDLPLHPVHQYLDDGQTQAV